jgi:hypothetical protein
MTDRLDAKKPEEIPKPKAATREEPDAKRIAVLKTIPARP